MRQRGRLLFAVLQEQEPQVWRQKCPYPLKLQVPKLRPEVRRTDPWDLQALEPVQPG